MSVAELRIGTATVLFTDLVGSTALRVRVGEEEADSLRVIHDDLLDRAIGSCRGVVVKHTGDGVMATFAAAADAVAAAVAIQQAVDAHNRRATGERFEVRVGISVGDVTFEGDDCFGLPVVEAQRLEAAAEGTQILCSEIVRHLARGRGGHEFVQVGDLALEGISDPVAAVEVRWEPVAQVALSRATPLPGVLSGPRGFDLAGRDAELAVLTDAWKESAEGRRRVVLVSGEPGIGKTRLATETARFAREQGALALAGRCDEELALPFQPFAEALRFQVGLGDEVPASWLGPLAGELARLVPDLPDRVPGLAEPGRSDPATERARLFAAVTGWLRTTTASVPVLLVLDDLQWADAPTLQLLRHVVHETPNNSLCVVGTFRSTDRAEPLAALVSDLCREGAATALALDGLTAEGVAEFVGRAAEHDLDAAAIRLAEALFAETGGNPFFVGEIVRHLVESGALEKHDGRWTSDLALEEFDLPEGVRDVVRRRVGRLDDPTQQLLSIAAVIGHEFALPVLAAVTDTDENRALDRLDAVRSTGLVDEIGVDRYRFGHALVRTALLDDLTATRRVRTHRKIAETIERLHAGDLDPVVTELAYHYGEAADADPQQALRYAVKAGDRAYATAAAEEAVRWYGVALAHGDEAGIDVGERVHLMTRRGQAEWSAGIGIATEQLLEAARLARDAGLDTLMAEALLVNVRTSFNEDQASDPQRIELLEYVLERLADDPARRARVMGTLAVELIYLGDTTRRGPLLDDARALAASSNDPLAIVYVSMCAFGARMPSTWSAARIARESKLLDEALASAESLGDPYWRSLLWMQRASTYSVANDGEGYRSATAMLEEISAASPGWVAGRGLMMQMMQAIAVIEGRLIEAEALSLEIFEIWRDVNFQEAIVYRSVQEFAVRREQGRFAEMIPAWTAFAAAMPRAASVAAGLAYVFADAGNLDEAAARLQAGAAGRFRDMPDDAAWSFAVAMWSETTALLRDKECAAMLHEINLPFDGTTFEAGGVVLGPAARLLARLEDVLEQSDNADRHFADAIEQSRHLGSPVWIARCQVDWARSLIDRGETEQARELIDAADATIGTLTLPRLQQQSAELRAHLR